jgi:hypothetical protein
MDRIEEALEIVRRAKALGDYDSNVIGMAAEIIAEERFGLVRTKSGSKDIDGYMVVNGEQRSVQVKAWSSSRLKRYQGGAKITIRTAGSADHLLVIVFYASVSQYEVIYNGPTNRAGKIEKSGIKRIILFKDLMHPTDVARICANCS